MGNGNTSAALVAGLPMDYLGMVLFLNENDAMVYSHIIDGEGNFVVRSADAFRENYFTRMQEQFEVFEGKEAEEYVSELQEAISNRSVYSTMVSMEGEQLHLYCLPLPGI